MWQSFLLSDSRVSSKNFSSFDPLTPIITGIYTDASSEVGFGCYFKGQWAQQKWDQEVMCSLNLGITWMELYAAVVAVHLWGDQYSESIIILNCDNESAIQMTNSRTSKSKTCMPLICILTKLGLEKNLVVKAHHVQGVHNSIADSLSRFEQDTFHCLAPGAEEQPLTLPASLWPICKNILKN